ncbi:stealth family protein [Microbacterium sp. SD291]|uniref:stealth family protein n=1 Tax=Microbacterium sp. SD291 TaxID=2782007 RepID=UPI001A95ACD8|nr:stealth family protein [Microbacterium sp. SD291]MBO0980000.1 stealth family protein [Microbacterium sp. SD291]
MANDTLPAFIRWAANRLPVDLVIWLKRFRREEHAWQRRQRALRAHLSAAGAASRTLRSAGGPVTVMERGYDAIRSVSQNVSQVGDALRAAGVEYVRLPNLVPFDPILVIRQDELHSTLDALAQLRAADGWSVRIEDARHRALTAAASRRRPSGVFRIVVSRRIVGPSGHLMSTPRESVAIEPWVRTREGEARADGSTHVAGTVRRRSSRRGPFVEYLTPQAWIRAVGGDHALDWPGPHLYHVTEPIDVVYTWVNDDDPQWQTRKRRASGRIDDEEVNDTALNPSRYANRDELKYSLRSVEAYANWVDHIYIVTDRQVPDWLNAEHPRITMVDHREIFSDASVLPVFNSHAIESQLHHIPGLSERYVYMNDDVFFMRPVSPELFFTSSGLSKFFPSRAPLDIDDASPRDLPVLSAAKNGREFMILHHGRTVTNKFKHTPHPQLRSVLQDMEAEHPDLFRSVASSKFRAAEDHSIASSLYHFHAFALQRAVVGDIAYDYVDIAGPRAALRLEWFSYQGRLDVVCLNDTDVDAAGQEQVSTLLTDFLERRFSIASSFEL